jgi:hypothetical protein
MSHVREDFLEEGILRLKRQGNKSKMKVFRAVGTVLKLEKPSSGNYKWYEMCGVGRQVVSHAAGGGGSGKA